MTCMPPQDEDATVPARSLAEVVEHIGAYPEDAYRFVQQGLNHTVCKIHGNEVDPQKCRHISGQELSHGLREFALQQYGMLARTVLGRWNITSTYDFGRIVFALIESGFMSKTDEDTIEDFRNVYDFRSAFDGASYRIEYK
jgi:uncharacterized repeat protein (TIGR04138 family)